MAEWWTQEVLEIVAGLGLDADLVARRFFLRRVLPGLHAGVDGVLNFTVLMSGDMTCFRKPTWD